MTYCVDAAVDLVQTAASTAVIDRIVPEPQSRQLAPRDNPVLPHGESGHVAIHQTISQLTAYVTVNCEPVRHAATLAGKTAHVGRGVPQLCPEPLAHRHAAPAP